MRHVAVALSGGVDSAVAAALLVQQGFRVFGVMLHLWNEPGAEKENRCCTPEDMALARRVAAKLDIPFFVLDARHEFYYNVVRSFLDGYAQGITPNPCLVCNRIIRWQFLLQYVLALGADALATGHYARLRCDESERILLLRARDTAKDQSYVLHMLNQEILQRAVFPLGEYTKPQVRHLARQLGLPVAERPESQDLCFLGNSTAQAFLLRHAPHVSNPGPILDRAGHLLGNHSGLAFYTIGQRKGLGIASTHPLYVLAKDSARNALIVGPVGELGKIELTASDMNWISGLPPESPLRAQVKIRYKAPQVPATITPLDSRIAHMRFDYSLRDITPGQAAVIYDGEVCLGGGIIQVESFT
ncbi:MAG: tRNA 2-thiouridine(34) synthase MnmA [Anaerolineales bacterium]|nr:tRNA 2-thiouridine(34) synthase MnmA [Anaerolineales bacterium]